MTDHGATRFFLYQVCILRMPSDVLIPKFGGLLLARHLSLQDGDVILDRIIHQALDYLKLLGCLAFKIFGVLRIRCAEEKLRAAGLPPRIMAYEEQDFPRSGRERLGHIRFLDGGGAPRRDVRECAHAWSPAERKDNRWRVGSSSTPTTST